MNIGPIVKEISQPVLDRYVIFKPPRPFDYPGIGFFLVLRVTVLVMDLRINTPELVNIFWTVFIDKVYIINFVFTHCIQ